MPRPPHLLLQNWPAQLQLCGDTCNGIQYNASGSFYYPQSVVYNPSIQSTTAYYSFNLTGAWLGTALTNRDWICLYNDELGNITKRSEASLTVYAPPPPPPPPPPSPPPR